MFNQTETQQKSAPTKKRIGRARFLLEFLIAAALLKVGSGAYIQTIDGLGALPKLLGGIAIPGIGYFLMIWASMKRLRDIKRSKWWVTVLIVPIPLALIVGFLGPDVIVNTYVWTVGIAVGIAYMIIYLLFLGILLFRPSAFPKDIGVATMTGKQPSTEAENRENETTTGESVSDIEDKAFAQAAAELNTNQRDAGVWARAYSDAEGDDNRAKALYIRYRAQRISKS